MEYPIEKIKSEIIEKQDVILNSINLESIKVYLFIKNQYNKGDILDNELFQFVFKAFYALNSAGLGDDFKRHYFKLLENKTEDLKKILLELYEIKIIRNVNSVQFSFATKLLHTINENYPIFDSEVARVIHKNTTGSTKDKKISSSLEVYELLKNIHLTLLEDDSIKEIILKFRGKFNINDGVISNSKILDFILWTLGKLNKKK